ncbi:MAG: sulfur reduction protein DsrE [Glaciihabitans sp.]|nr:sulfur reduction protein DsrE [Glaciihabitans sp.]
MKPNGNTPWFEWEHGNTIVFVDGSPARQGELVPDIDQQIIDNIEKSRGEIAHPSLPKGSNIYGSTKIFPDYQAENGESYFTLVHGIAHESSVSFVAILQATRALRKGYESAIYFYGPGAMNAMATRGFPTTGDSAFPGEQNINGSLETFIKEGGTVFVCRFGLSLHGLREEDLIEGAIPAHPLDVQDALIHYARKGAIINSTYNF